MAPKAPQPPARAGAPSAPDAPPSPAGAQQRQFATTIADLELPKTSLTKLAKGSIPDNVKMQQDVVHALMRSSTLFISYLTATAHDQALSRSGKSVTASDVLKAITELDFGPADALVPLLEQELQAYRQNLAATKAAKAKPPGPGRGKGRRKSAADGEGDVSMAGDGDEGDDGEEGEEGEGDEEEDEEGGEEGDDADEVEDEA
ncbi:DNA polymerase epsilon subunit 3 [Vanrija pseudolonga]|uniref:DNA polymerase epsilon subunit D n=1 Tax=Vanrija pseudolonga TaxID=143232 RepID=A0AAF0Y332_9TREE|nr:DNA polymerase epsilon subunit 3 [Vanrija pseudolonga]